MSSIQAYYLSGLVHISWQIKMTKERWGERTVKIKSSLSSVNDIQNSRKGHDIIETAGKVSYIQDLQVRVSGI